MGPMLCSGCFVSNVLVETQQNKYICYIFIQRVFFFFFVSTSKERNAVTTLSSRFPYHTTLESRQRTEFYVLHSFSPLSLLNVFRSCCTPSLDNLSLQFSLYFWVKYKHQNMVLLMFCLSEFEAIPPVWVCKMCAYL